MYSVNISYLRIICKFQYDARYFLFLVPDLFYHNTNTNCNKMNIKYLIVIVLTQGSAILFCLDRVPDAVHIVSKLEFLVQL